MNIQEKQGYLGDLAFKTTTELLEILQRQEQILDKKKFVESLPDKGRKINEFAEKLRSIIHSKDPSLLQSSDTRIPVGNGTEHTNTSMCIEHTDFESGKQVLVNVQAGTQKASPVPVTLKPENSGLSDQPAAETVKVNSNINNSAGRNPVQLQDDGQEVSTAVVDSRGITLPNQMQRLESEFNNMEIGGLESDISARLDEEKCTNAYRKAMALSVQEPRYFKTNSSLKIKDIKDLPEKYKPPPEIVKTTKSVVWNIHDGDSAATPPMYKNPNSRLITLEESVHLQKQQKAKQEELQAKCAAEKLGQRFQVTMETYNPEGVDMSYRNTEQEIDSDDDPE